MYLTASSARSGSFAAAMAFLSAPSILNQYASLHTFELDQEVERILVRRRAFPDVSSQDRIRIVEQVALLEVLSHEVTDRVDLVGRVAAPRM